MRIDRADGSRLVLAVPQATADSLVGSTEGRRAGVALADIREIAVRRVDPLKTTALVLGSAVVAAAAGILIAFATFSWDFN